MTRERVLVAMSGGVDSSVAAAMLVEQGYDVIGATMKLFCYGDEVPDRPCCSLDSIDDARRVCEGLGVPHYVLNMEDAFGRDVLQNFVSEYARGRTPIPCVRCNSFTKFRDLLHKADALDAPWIATGHYAQAAGGELFRGLDPAKDQSYFLWGIDRAVVSRMLLPVGALTKAETRARARAMGLSVVAAKPESQDICFVPGGDHSVVLAKHLAVGDAALARGPFVLRDGRRVGEHEGFARFTVGQRRGLPGGYAEPMFVVAIRPAERAVVIGPREELLGRGIIAREMNWLVSEEPGVGERVQVQIRHHASPAAAEIVRVAGNEIELALDEPVSAISPGQSLVLYDGARVLGGGVIEAGRAEGATRVRLPIFAA